MSVNFCKAQSTILIPEKLWKTGQHIVKHEIVFVLHLYSKN